MKLNRSQRLVHEYIAMTKFWSNHNILNEILIERPGPNNVATIVGVEDRILVRTSLIHQVGLRFPIDLMLKEVMAHCRLTFIWRVRIQHLSLEEDRVVYRGNKLGQVRLLPLCIREQAPRCQRSSSLDVSKEWTELLPSSSDLGEEAEGPPSRLTSFEVKKRKRKFKRGKRLSSLTIPDLPSVLPALRNKVNHSFVEGVDSNFEVAMPPTAKKLNDALAPKKFKVVAAPTVQDPILVQVPALVPAPSIIEPSLPSPQPKKDKGKAPDVGPSRKCKQGEGQESWLAYLKEFGILADLFAWNAEAPEVVIPNPHEPYSPMILPGFNEEEYANQPEEEEAKGEDEVGDARAEGELRAGAGASGVRDQDIPRSSPKLDTLVACEYLSEYLLSTLPCAYLRKFRARCTLGYPSACMAINTPELGLGGTMIFPRVQSAYAFMNFKQQDFNQALVDAQ
ncbi:hypothetical protein Acr_00g0031310 [Actinidia rufa]|uniref:Uncharacterized protein n=1 Tax=Actinidia rufa TaxID=165716 RepID=A0A7J0DF27_9ERIC|nr:hypothetical protein Acr_00g0031310 [Actinidia rufa]